MLIFLQGFVFSLIIIKIAPAIFKNGFSKKNSSQVFMIFALIQLIIQISVHDKSLIENLSISIAMGFIGLLGSALYKMILDKKET